MESENTIVFVVGLIGIALAIIGMILPVYNIISCVPVFGSQRSYSGGWAFQGDMRCFFDKSAYDNILSIRYVSVVLVTSDNATIQLYDLTNAVILWNSSIFVSGGGWQLLKSEDFKNELPNSEVDLMVRMGTNGSAILYHANMYIEITIGA